MMERLAVLGPGVLGLSLSQWAVERGLRVRLMGRDSTHALAGARELKRRWEVLVQKGKLSPEAAMGCIERLETSVPGDWDGCDALLEATPEDPDTKASVWKGLVESLPAELLCLTGSSALPVGPLAEAAGLTGRLLGFHLFVPVRSMRVVELVIPPSADPTTIQRAKGLGEALGLRIAEVKDGVGYAAARMSLALGIEAMRLLEEGVASAEDLDALMRLGYGHPVGPIELSDRVGLDLRLAIAERLEAQHGPRFRPPECLRLLVAQGHHGRKSGQGFLEWPRKDAPWT